MNELIFRLGSPGKCRIFHAVGDASDCLILFSVALEYESALFPFRDRGSIKGTLHVSICLNGLSRYFGTNFYIKLK